VLSRSRQRGDGLGPAPEGRGCLGDKQHAARVLGIAVLVSVFARQGVYKSPHVLIDGFTQALWVGVGFSALGAVAALLAPGRQRPAEATGDGPLPRGPLGSWVDSVGSRVLNPRGAPRRVSCAIRSIRRSPQSRSFALDQLLDLDAQPSGALRADASRICVRAAQKHADTFTFIGTIRA
jgi:hypothetical protein